MSTGAALTVVMSAGVIGVLTLVGGVGLVARVTGRLPTTRQTMSILVAIGVAMLVVVVVVWPEAPADPVLVTPTTYGPSPDPLAGYDASELP